MKAKVLPGFVWISIGISTVFLPYSIKSKTTETVTTTATAAVTANRVNNAMPGGLDVSQFVGVDNSNNVGTASSDSKAIQPFRAGASVDGSTIVIVPEGKLLVIELVTGSVSTQGTDSEVAVRLVTSSGPTFSGIYDIAPSHARPTGADTYAVYTQSVRIYVLPGERLMFFFPADGAALGVSVSGYFVDER